MEGLYCDDYKNILKQLPDNSVDLIINDGKSAPKLINSRFSAVGKNRY